jgi:ABC-type branched-subunit amino acid transport system substrate-binding protein
VEKQHDIASIPVVGSAALTPQVMPYGFSMLLNAADQAEAMVNYAKKKNYTRVAILHDSGEQGLSADSALKTHAGHAGMTVTGDQQYSVGDSNISAQALSLKRGNPEAVLLFPTSGTDVGHVLQAMQDLSWNVPVVGGYGAHYSSQIAQVSGAASMNNLTATTYAPFGACSGQSAPAATGNFISAIKAFKPSAFASLALDLAAASADSVGIMKQAMEGAGSTSGAKFAAWMETNAQSISGLINPSVSASSSSHYLFGPSDMVLVHPGTQVSDGVYARADC